MLLRALVALLLAACLAPGQELPPEVQGILGLAYASPPEFAADALLRLAGSEKVRGSRQKLALLEQAFQLAFSAHFPIKRVDISAAPETREQFQGRAYELNLDAVSLQCRAVKAILPLDKRKARDLFGQIVLRLEPLSCEDALVWDVAEYYATLKEVARTSFTDEEKARKDHLRFLRFHLESITSPLQLAPAMRVLNEYKLWRDDYAHLVLALTRTLERMNADPRSLAASFVPRTGMTGEFGILYSYCRAIGLADPDLLAAYRGFLVRHFAGQVLCENTQIMLGQGPIFNSMAKNFGSQLPPISQEENSPERLEGAPKTVPYWQSANARSLRVAPQRIGSEDHPPEWRQYLAESDAVLDAWKPTDEPAEADYFHQKATVYTGLLRLLPRGPERDDVLERCVRFVAGSSVRRQSPPEWFLHARELFAGKDTLPQVLELIARSGDPSLALYAALKRAALF